MGALLVSPEEGKQRKLDLATEIVYTSVHWSQRRKNPPGFMFATE